MRLSIWEPGLHCTNIAVKTSLALQIVFSMVSEWCWHSTRVSLWCFIKSQRIFQVNNYASVDYQNQVFVWLLISWKFIRTINKKGGTEKQKRRPVNTKMLLPNKRLWTAHECLNMPGHGVVFLYDSNRNMFLINCCNHM